MPREAGWEPETGRVKPGCLGAAAMTDWQRRCRWAQPWTLLLLLLGPRLLVSHSWGPEEKEGDDDQRFLKNYPPATVEYALHMYNRTSQGRSAYEEVDIGLVFSMELQFARTRCGKFDIDNCPFQATPDVNNTDACYFTIATDPWRTKFKLLNDTCLDGSAE
ncbi:cystatin-9-like isoform X2 [Cervus elaphus]|uniref:cystatin-9-like isoform X2 n=1 Tax=Cervus elaphus TaxID=9860 RepID=UPI001CC2C288|nr:cystatin-9-like isoform X2 [Cervus elaphus]